MADGSITVEVSTQAAQAELQRLRDQNAVLTEQVRALWRALAKVLDTLQPDAVHIATEGPLGWAARKHWQRRLLGRVNISRKKLVKWLQA